MRKKNYYFLLMFVMMNIYRKGGGVGWFVENYQI